MFVSISSYPPRGQARTTVQDAHPSHHLPLPCPSSSSSSAASGNNNRSLQNTRGTLQASLTVDCLLLQPEHRCLTSEQVLADTDRHFLQLLEDIGAGIDPEVLEDVVDPTQQLATACISPALPIPDTAACCQEAAVVAISRALSDALLDITPDSNTAILGSCGSLLDTIGSCASLISLGSCIQPPMDLTPEEFASLAAELAPVATSLQTLRNYGSNLPPAGFEALTEVPAEAVSHQIQVADLECAETLVPMQESELQDALLSRDMDQKAPPIGFSLGDDGILPCERFISDLQESPPALNSGDWSADSYPPQMAGNSDLSDARSGCLQPLTQHESEIMPLSHATVSTAAPDLAMGQQGATMARAGGSAHARHDAAGSRRRGRSRAAAAAIAQSRVLRNRQLQKEYALRKRARAAIAHSLAHTLRSRVENLTADIQALHMRQGELLQAQEPPQAVCIANMVTPSDWSSSMDAIPMILVEDDAHCMEQSDWHCLAAAMDITVTQKAALVQLFLQMASELNALNQERKQLAEKMKVTTPAALTCKSVCTELLTITDISKKVRSNLEVVSRLQGSFENACHEVQASLHLD